MVMLAISPFFFNTAIKNVLVGLVDHIINNPVPGP